jgi:hypothetical protein
MDAEKQLAEAIKQLEKADEMLSITKRFRGLFSKQNFEKWRAKNNELFNHNIKKDE